MLEYECKCRYCGSSNNIHPYGYSTNGKRRYLCKDCGRTFTLGEDKRIKHLLLERMFCLTSYLGGASMRSIQKTLSISLKKKISFNIITHWLKNADKIVKEELKERQKELKSKELKIVEMDELFTYIKKNPEILTENIIVIKEYGLLLIGMKVLY